MFVIVVVSVVAVIVSVIISSSSSSPSSPSSPVPTCFRFAIPAEAARDKQMKKIHNCAAGCTKINRRCPTYPRRARQKKVMTDDEASMRAMRCCTRRSIRTCTARTCTRRTRRTHLSTFIYISYTLLTLSSIFIDVSNMQILKKYQKKIRK